MTIEAAKHKWLAWMYSQVGYHETGDNCTRYEHDYDFDEKAYGFSMHGQPWCDHGFDFSFWINFGYELGQKMLYQEGKYGGAACPNSAQFYKSNNAYFYSPEVGDQIFYSNFSHTGGVVAVEGNQITCIDFNWSDSVCERKLSTTDSSICGYGRPNWSLVESAARSPKTAEEIDDAEEEEAFQVGQFVKVKPGAKWFDGKDPHPIVYEHSWEIVQINGERAVLNNSEDGAYHIMSPISTKYLVAVNNSELTEEDLTKEEFDKQTFCDICNERIYPDETYYDLPDGLRLCDNSDCLDEWLDDYKHIAQ